MHPQIKWILFGLALFFAGLTLPVLPAMAQQTERPPPMVAFGKSMVAFQCLRFTGLGYRDHSGSLDNFDWITLILKNECPQPLRYVQIELYLVDARGRAFGRRLWVLGQGDGLMPESSRRDRYAIPDPDNLSALGWTVRVNKADKMNAGARKR